MSRILRSIVSAFASLWLTLACLLAAGAVALAGQFGDFAVATWIAVPFALLGLNLLAALADSPKLRRQGGLLGFHLSLAVLAFLAAVDQLVALRGHVEVTEGTAFDAGLVEARAGPLHPWLLDRVAFVQDGFEINYAPAVKRRDTQSFVRIPMGEGLWQSRTVGDDRPLVFGSYRFYTSFNKGFAPVLTYVDAGGRAQTGAVHLPSYPLNYHNQGNSWTLPDGSAAVKLWLHLPEPVYDEARHWRFRKPDDAVLVLIADEVRHELRPGESLPLGPGLLRYEALRSWMGYTISYNPLMPWMLAAVAVAVCCFGWHAARRVRAFPWEAAAGKEGAHAA